jgi:kynurenine formamidase
MTGLPHRLLVLCVAAAAAGCGSGSPGPQTSAPPAAASLTGAIVDLSHAYGADTVYWPTAEKFKLSPVASGVSAAGYYYAANTFATSEHGGTHIDAPVHFAEKRNAVDEIPLDQLVGPAVVIDISAACDKNADYLMVVSDVDAFERAHGRIPDGSIVLVRTGYSSRWPDAARYLGTAERGEQAVPKLHFPGVDAAAAGFLLRERKLHALGIDTASIDYGQSKTYDTHRLLYEANVPGLENLTSLDRLPPTGAFVVALPMKIKGGSGAPLRAIALVKDVK